MNTYEWTPERLDAYPEKDGFNDVVFVVYWRVTATDGEHEATVAGSQMVEMDPEGDFTPYDKLTKDQVLSWVQASMGQGKIAEIESYLDQQIANQIKPPEASPALPWSE
jgi:hypothetical protein